jgi:O-methyltransferase
MVPSSEKVEVPGTAAIYPKDTAYCSQDATACRTALYRFASFWWQDLRVRRAFRVPYRVYGRHLVKQLMLKCLDLVGLKEPLRAQASARGFLRWDPLVPKDEFYACIVSTLGRVKAAKGNKPFGEYLEFGVSRGTSTALVHQALNAQGLAGVHIFGFDSFEGLPPEAEGQGWGEGQFHSTLAATRRYLKKEGVDLNRVTLTKGWFRDTCTEATRDTFPIKNAGLILIDCDIYTASKEALFFCEPLIQDCTAIVFDDWGWREKNGEIGQKEAFQEFLDAFPSLDAKILPGYRPEARVFLVTRKSRVPTKSVEQRSEAAPRWG